MDFKRIEIIEGFYAHEYTNILPARENAQGDFGYVGKEDDQISIACYHLYGYLGKLLDDNIQEETQIGPDQWYGRYDEYGWNYYTPAQMRNILSGLREFIKIVSDDPFDSRFVQYLSPASALRIPEEGENAYALQRAAELVDFYSRFVSRIERMLENMEGYDLIGFVGP